ncbi:hypothetical protein GLOTRDRAFT_123360 [Gloeophyllum trabeum ATCC 11539]|uniref:Uncharacterized protein n=1 Tax=Gloeophyllum trabeum (strain ATCC 11539 / FP-39264 / Madison 617) TaxID=670483 RepID=S7PUP7_GLOTA|nr:uncharacterized protein GLOTRDRAFT_123360 [Gloeophyllum trabeum ATCC 11539]EPQ51133.1 hypothetical protein GLOTRDRAFT_123360 [Gloeophyllum trabeum ATCC 11539]
MKFLFVVASLVASALAQTIDIGAPASGTTVSPGSSLTVEVDRPNSLTGSEEIAIVIGLRPCYNNYCVDPAEAMGTILYNGDFNPQYSTEPGTGSKPPHQNFTVTVPSNIQSGPAILSVAHLSLVGAGPWPMFEVKNTSVTISN